MGSYFNDTQGISRELGFNLAFAISSYDGSNEITEDPDYGVVKAQYRRWNTETDFLVEVEDILTR